MFESPANFIAFGFGAGLSPVAPGTFGTLVAVPIYLGLSNTSTLTYALFLAVGFVVGIYFCARAADSLQSHDHPAIVWDEIMGYLATMCLVPVSLYTIIFGFLLFRFFDILKPWPIRVIDRQVHGGFGIMIDDLIAAAFAAIVLRAILPLLS